MSSRNVVPGPFGDEVPEHLGGVHLAQPGPGVLAHDTVVGVGAGSARGRRRAGGRAHAGHRTAGRLAAATALLATLLVPLGLGLGSPAGASESASSDEKVTFTVGMLNEVDSFNPFSGIVAESYEMWALNYDYLVGYSMKDMSPQPTGLAESWESSEDGLTWTYNLRDDAVFSDGEPLTSADVVHTLERIRDGGYEATTWGPYLASVEEIEAPDDTTVVLRLSEPNSTLPLIAVPILPEHVWSEIDEEEVKTYPNEPEDGEPVVGSGPFRLVEGTAGGSEYRFEANPDYWKGAPHIDEVVFRVFKSEDTAVQALIKGEIDFVEEINTLQVESLQGREGITAVNADSPGFDEIAFNVGAVDTDTGEPLGDGHPALQDRDFRYALGFALDREEIIEKAYQGAGTPGDSIIPPAYDNFRWEPSEDQAFTFDLEKADDLLTEAGYERGPDGERLMPDGSPVGTLRLFARSESTTSLTVSEYVAEWFGQLGLDVELTPMEDNRLTNVILDGEYDMFEWGWYVEPDPSTMLSYLTCDQLGGWNDAWWCNEEYDELYQAQSTAVTDEERVDAVQQMQEIFFEEAPYLVTAYGTQGEAVRTDRFACFHPQPEPNGILLFQYGVANYLSVRPADEAGDCDGNDMAIGASGDVSSGGDDGGSSTMLMVGGAAVLAVLVVGGSVVAMRRRSTAGDRE